jgi:hypothetical protein
LAAVINSTVALTFAWFDPIGSSTDRGTDGIAAS